MHVARKCTAVPGQGCASKQRAEARRINQNLMRRALA
ncbi:hypothetical protein RHECNPAF_750027 [Rhizobium etli CNPAF512]|nr:hypothetical protein RHECNPAF_750027 [Rhizobium etli CNPAF512]